MANPWHGIRYALLAIAALVAALSLLGGPAASHPTQVVSQCRSADVTAGYHRVDAGMSHVYGRLRLVNTSDHACWLRGYGGLSYVGGGNGTQVGAAADRTPVDSIPKVVLEPGDRAVSPVSETSAAPYPKKKCRPTPVDGFRVYVPDATTAQFVAHRTTGCANSAVHLLAHKPFHAVH
jgi:hypothetical protein